jgi:hypothetical protein
MSTKFSYGVCALILLVFQHIYQWWNMREQYLEEEFLMVDL